MISKAGFLSFLVSSTSPLRLYMDWRGPVRLGERKSKRIQGLAPRIEGMDPMAFTCSS